MTIASIGKITTWEEKHVPGEFLQVSLFDKTKIGKSHMKSVDSQYYHCYNPVQ